MKLVFLPGMDGTGILFSPILAQLSDMDAEIISLPQSGPQDYEFLTAWVIECLPQKDFILIAESFSGPIAANISIKGCKRLKGIIFAASFLSSPSIFAIYLARILPLKRLIHLPGVSMVYRFFCFDENTFPNLESLFQQAIGLVPQSILSARLQEISRLVYNKFQSDIPVFIIQPNNDRLVSRKKIKEFKNSFSKLKIVEIDGPHFIFQVKPESCVNFIRQFVISIVD